MLYLFGAIAIFVIVDLLRGVLRAQDKKSYLIKSTIGLTVVITLLFLFGPLLPISPVKIGHDSLTSEGVTLYYPAGKIDMGKDIFEKVKQAASDNEKFYRTSVKTPILIGFSTIDMVRLGAPPQAGGVGNELGIILKGDKASTNVIAHEISHKNLVFVTGKSAFSFPRWFDEGLASYLGKMDYYKKPEELASDIKRGSYKNNLIDMKGIQGLLEWQYLTFRMDNPRQLYGQSYLMVKYLFDTYGKDKVYDFVIKLKTEDFDQAFLSVFGKSVNEFHKNFIDYASVISNKP